MGGLFSWWAPTTSNPENVIVKSRAQAAKVLPSGVNYDAEGAALMRRMSSSSDRLVMGMLSAVLGSPQSSSSPGAYHDVDVLWAHPETGALLYVGNDRAARSDAYLTSLKVSSIVNCTRPSNYGELDDYHKKSGRYSYYDIPLGHWVEYCLRNASGAELSKEEDRYEATLRFLVPAFIFALRALKQGRNVLVHCLAGAHRAGTMGVLLLMHLQGMAAEEAQALAQRLRPVIDPISDFPRLLGLFERASRWRAKTAGIPHGPAWLLPLTSPQHSFVDLYPSSSSSPQQTFASYGARMNRSKSMTAGSATLEAMAALQQSQQQYHDITEKFVPTSSRRPSNAGNTSGNGSGISDATPSLNRSGSFSAKTPRQTPRRKSQDPDSAPAASNPSNSSSNNNASTLAAELSSAVLASAFSATYQSDVLGGRGSPEAPAALRERRKPGAHRRYSLG